jgi:hypothetical protein
MRTNTSKRLDRCKARVTARAIAERRRHRRVAPALRAALLCDTGRESVVDIIDISAGGLAAHAAAPPRAGSRVVLLIDGIGRVEGVTARVDGERFGVRFTPLTERRRHRMADQLAWEVNQVELDLIDDRHTPRRVWTGPARVVLDDDEVSRARYADEFGASASFAALERPNPSRGGASGRPTPRII